MMMIADGSYCVVMFLFGKSWLIDRRLTLHQHIQIVLATLGLCCCVQAFSSYGKQGLLSGCSAWSSLVPGYKL